MRERPRWVRRLRRAARRMVPSKPDQPPRLREEDVVWIMGSPRTGSTWLLNLLGGLTNGARVDEPLIAPLLAAPATVVPGWPDRGDLVHDVARHRPHYVFADAHVEAWAPELSGFLLRRFAAGMPAHRDHGVVLVKEPHGAAGAPLLLRCMPRSRLLFLLRDGRDVVDSIVDLVDGGWGTETAGIDVAQHGGRAALIRSCARDWVRDTEAVERAYEHHDPARRILVRYEDLRSRPEDELARLLVWLGRPTEERRIREVVQVFDFDAIPDDRRGPGQFRRAAQPGLWREHFDTEERTILDDVMGPTLARLGYP